MSYLLLLCLVSCAIASTKLHSDEVNDISRKVGDRMGKLWDIAHQGMRENRFLRAEKALLTILKIDEKNAAAYNRLGILYAKQKEYRDPSSVLRSPVPSKPRPQVYIT